MRGVGDAKGNRLKAASGVQGVSGVPGRAFETDPMVVRWRRIERQIAAERVQFADAAKPREE